MQKRLVNPNKKDSEVATRIKRTAEMAGVSQRTVRRILKAEFNGEREVRNRVLMIYMELEKGESTLLSAVKKLIPFN